MGDLRALRSPLAFWEEIGYLVRIGPESMPVVVCVGLLVQVLHLVQERVVEVLDAGVVVCFPAPGGERRGQVRAGGALASARRSRGVARHEGGGGDG